MRTVVQRVKQASVTVNGSVVSAIGQGLLLLLGIEAADTEEDIQWLSHKVLGLRIFDDEEGSEELNPDGSREVIGDGCVYDLMGRKVATREQVEDGSWKQRVATGIYIINGKKIRR